MPEEEEGLIQSKGGVPSGAWTIPVRLAARKNKEYGMGLYVEFVEIRIDMGSSVRPVSIGWMAAEVVDYRQLEDMEGEAFEHEVESLLDSDIVPEEEEDDEGNMVTLSDGEREDRARDLARESEIEYGREIGTELLTDIKEDESVPAFFGNRMHAFWSSEWLEMPDVRSEDQIDLVPVAEREFIGFVTRRMWDSFGGGEDGGGVPRVARDFALAVRDIAERWSRTDFVATFRKIVPVWTYLRLKYALNTLKHEEREGDTALLQKMRVWLKQHKTEMDGAALRMLSKKEIPGGPEKVKRGAQMTVEMKKAKKRKPRTNPEDGLADDLADYYHAVGIDPEVPVNWLLDRGETPDRIFAAAERLLAEDRIDPPDYWAIQEAVMRADYHVVVPTAAANPHRAHERLKKAISEKHGPLPDEVDRTFKRLRAAHKDRSDEEVMDMVREKLGLKKRMNPGFKNAREALKAALKRMTTIEVVEYQPYQPPAEPTIEESLESLERTAAEAVAEEEATDEGVRALEDLQTEMAQDDWKRMFERERKEHPTLPEETIETIVEDHMKGGQEQERENPTAIDKMVEAFWDEREARGSMVARYGRYGDRDAIDGRRDEVQVRYVLSGVGSVSLPPPTGDRGLPTGGRLVKYMLWGNLIASIDTDERGHRMFGISTAGWDTILTHGRLAAILREGGKRYPILRHFDIERQHTTTKLYRKIKVREPDPKEPWQAHRWEELCEVPPTLYRATDIPKGVLPKHSLYIDLDANLKENIDRITGKALKQEIAEMEVPVDTLEEVQTVIDAIERDIRAYRAANRDFESTPVEVAEKLGTRQEYEDLLKQRDELMWRGNPKIPYTPPDAPDVEVKCPVTDKYTWSCTRCALFDGRSEQFIECKARRGKKYYLAKTHDKRGTVWDTYVLPRSQRKAGIETRAIGGD